METGGAPRASVKGLDEFNPFMCSPCCRKEIDVEAEVYCIQCEEYFCRKCHSHHNRLTNMAAHTMLDRERMGTRGSQQPQPLLAIQPILTVPCDIHPDQVYTLFCEKHNQVCCPACFPLHHKSCDVKYILDTAKTEMQGPDQDELGRTVKIILNNLEKVKKQRKSNMQRITEQKNTEVDKIHEIIQQIIEELESIEKIAVNDVTRKFTEFKTKIENDLTMLDTVINALNTKLDKFEEANHDTEKFVHMKMCEEDKCSAGNLIKDIEVHVGVEQLEFLIDEHFAQSIRKLQSLGELVYGHAVTSGGQHRVDTKKDKNDSSISGICLAGDGSLLLTDSDNKCLKRLDPSYRVIDRLKLDNSPHGVCSISKSQVAVCVRDSRCVQLVTLEPTLSKSGSFKTTGCCRGIVHDADHLYVSCGGRRDWSEDPGHIAVYTIAGELLWKFEKDSQGQLFSSGVLDVAVRNSDGVILVCDDRNGLVALKHNGQRLWTITCKALDVERVNRVIVDSHGQALVSSYRSNKVVLVSRAGRMVGTVLTARDGINKPNSLHIDAQCQRLIVGMRDNNQLTVFKLTYRSSL